MEALDYRLYKLTRKQYLFFGALFLTAFSLTSLLFYDSFLPLVFFCPIFIPAFKILKKLLNNNRRNILRKQFLDALQAISASLEAGSSMENSLWDAYLQICILYSKKSYMALELAALHNKVSLGVPVEIAFYEFANRTDIDDIKTFCEILKIAKRTNGNLIQIIKASSDTMNEKFDISREISININAKKFEQIIMCFVPFLIIIYMKVTSPGFFDPLYQTPLGIIFITLCLGIYALAIFISSKLLNIKI